MAASTRKKIMVVNRKAPHGTIYPMETLEIVLIGSAFDQDISVVFLDDGVYALVKEQNTRAIETKNFSAAYRALADYEVKQLIVERESLEARGLAASDLLLPVEVISAAELTTRMAQQDMILGS